MSSYTAGHEFLLVAGTSSRRIFAKRRVIKFPFIIVLCTHCDTQENLQKLLQSLTKLHAEWGPTDQTWGPIRSDVGWLKAQAVFCLLTQAGPLDVFREVRGLEGRYDECSHEAALGATAAGTAYRGLSDRHMLETQLALPEAEQKPRRIAALKKALGQAS